MKPRLFLFTLWLVCALGSSPRLFAQAAKPDAVTVDPTHHHVIMENDHVRVFEVLAAPGARSPVHIHPATVVASLSKARLRMTGPDGSKSIFDLNPAQVIWLENVEHSWELLAGQLHVIGVEIKAAR